MTEMLNFDEITEIRFAGDWHAVEKFEITDRATLFDTGASDSDPWFTAKLGLGLASLMGPVGAIEGVKVDSKTPSSQWLIGEEDSPE